jgi:hypothetical protein
MLGFIPKKINLDSIARNEKIISYVQKIENYFELKMEVESVINNLVFESSSEVFEKAVEDLDKILGYESIRPDKENNDGPYNLWKIDSQNFLVIECKTGVDSNRSFIRKSEAGQMSVHIARFKKNYPTNSKFIMVYPKQKMLDTAAHFDDDVSALRTGKLNQLKKNVSSFFKEFQNDNFHSLSIDTINKWL